MDKQPKKQEAPNTNPTYDKQIKDLQDEIKKLQRLIGNQIQPFPFVSGTPTNNGYIPMIIEGKKYNIATVS